MRDEVALSEARMTPPRPPIAFRVGVVGHRPDRLPRDEAGLEVLRARLAQVLEAVADAVHAFAAGPDAEFYASAATPILRANSPLAEGADRLFAEEALRLGYHLNCVMPFAQTEFEQDFQGPEAFEPQALEAFRALLARARALGALTRFELDGRRGRAREAYEAAGRVVLNQSDLLVVVWDGGGPNGAGGTVDTLRDAITYKVPALWIDARAPNGWRLLRDAVGLDCLAEETPCPPEVAPDAREEERQLREAIFSVVTGELALPPANAAAGAPSPETQRGLRAYLAERKPRANFAVLWKLFRDLMDGGRLRWPSFAVPDFVGAIRAGWPVDTDGESPHPGATASWINERLRAHYAWSDKLADHYADAHRSGFVWSSLLAAAAVFTALLPLAAHLRPRPAIAIGVIEALILTALVGLPILARRRRWHQRWMDYRVLAELIRELRIMIPLGGAQPPPRTSPHLASYGDPARSWMYWQVRAIGRATGLPDARVTAAYIADQVADLLDFIAGQSAFHHMNCERMTGHEPANTC